MLFRISFPKTYERCVHVHIYVYTGMHIYTVLNVSRPNEVYVVTALAQH